MAPREGGDKQGFEGNCGWNQNLDILIKPCVTKLIRVASGWICTGLLSNRSFKKRVCCNGAVLKETSVKLLILPTPVKIVYPKNRHINISRGIDRSQKFIKWNPPFKVGGTNIFFVEMTFAATCAPQTLRGGFHFMIIWCFGSRASVENWDNYFHGIVARAGVPVWFDPHGHLYAKACRRDFCLGWL